MGMSDLEAALRRYWEAGSMGMSFALFSHGLADDDYTRERARRYLEWLKREQSRPPMVVVPR